MSIHPRAKAVVEYWYGIIIPSIARRHHHARFRVGLPCTDTNPGSFVNGSSRCVYVCQQEHHTMHLLDGFVGAMQWMQR